MHTAEILDQHQLALPITVEKNIDPSAGFTEMGESF